MKKSSNQEINKSITESIPQYFFAYDFKKDKIIHLTDSFHDYIKYEQGTDIEKIKSTIHPVYHLAFDSMFMEIQKGNLEQDVDLKTKSEKDEVRWVNIRTFPINSHKVAGQVFDITDKKRREEELRKESNRFELMLHLLIHDLRSPVANISEFAKLIDKALEKGNLLEAGMYSEILQRLTLESTDMLNALTEMIEINSSDFNLKIKPINLRRCIIQVIENYSIRYSKKNINLQYDIPENTFEVEADETKLRLVFQNLLSNAIKFTNDGGNIKIYSEVHTDKVDISLMDDGVGIPGDKINTIFDQFTTAKRNGTKGEKSVGLGLSITKKIIELHNGSIRVKSENGKGSTFTVSLPLKMKAEKLEVPKRKLN